VRSTHEVPVESTGLEPLLSLLDQTQDFEFVLAGYRFQLDELEARVYSIHAVSDPLKTASGGATNTTNTVAGPTHRLRGLPWLVELSGLCSDDQRVAVELRLWIVAKQLEPLLAFSSTNPVAPKA
jgi:hypothetical protein